MAMELGADLDEDRASQRAALAREMDEYAYQGTPSLLIGSDGKVVMAVSGLADDTSPVDEMPAMKPRSVLPEKSGLAAPLHRRLSSLDAKAGETHLVPHYLQSGNAVTGALIDGVPVAATADQMLVAHLGGRKFLVGDIACQVVSGYADGFVYQTLQIPNMEIEVAVSHGFPGCYIGLLCYGNWQELAGSYHFIITSIDVAARQSLVSESASPSVRGPTFYEFQGDRVFQPCAYVIPPGPEYPFPIIFYDRDGSSLPSQLAGWPVYDGFDG